MPVMTCNTSHIENLPRRKTDAKDAEQVVIYLNKGILNLSFIFIREHRKLRVLNPFCQSQILEHATNINQLQKFLGVANVRICCRFLDIANKNQIRLHELIIGKPVFTVDEFADGLWFMIKYRKPLK
ncbi:MAG: hypothetical protein FWG10_05550 [Eubacteriaceae bacterium]|nr:hypothetical protein [Eubacteriaceae bacterium]